MHFLKQAENLIVLRDQKVDHKSKAHFKLTREAILVYDENFKETHKSFMSMLAEDGTISNGIMLLYEINKAFCIRLEKPDGTVIFTLTYNKGQVMPLLTALETLIEGTANVKSN